MANVSRPGCGRPVVLGLDAALRCPLTACGPRCVPRPAHAASCLPSRLLMVEALRFPSRSSAEVALRAVSMECGDRAQRRRRFGSKPSGTSHAPPPSLAKAPSPSRSCGILPAHSIARHIGKRSLMCALQAPRLPRLDTAASRTYDALWTPRGDWLVCLFTIYETRWMTAMEVCCPEL